MKTNKVLAIPAVNFAETPANLKEVFTHPLTYM